MRYLLTGLLLFMGVVCLAQKQNVYFFKNNGSEVTVRDSADYVRVLREPDSGAVNYKVTEVYKNGKPKLVGESSTVEPLTFEGQLITYFPTGKRASIEKFKGGHVTDAYNYYPNGRLQAVIEYPDSLSKENQFENHLLKTYNDTTGKALVADGEGYYAGYAIEAKDRYQEGKISKGKKEGDWKGNYNADKVTFTETYKNGRLRSGASVTGDGKSYSYTTEQSIPDLGNADEYMKAINKDLNIMPAKVTSQESRTEIVQGPAPAAGTMTRMQSSRAYQDKQIFNSTAGSMPAPHGRVDISFIIEKNGTTKDFKVIKSVDADLDQKALKSVTKIIKNKKDIKPGILFGLPVNTQFTIPVMF